MTSLRPRRTLVLLDGHRPIATAADRAALERAGHVVRFIDYANLDAQAASLRELVVRERIELALFGRNDQVGDFTGIGPLIRALEIGYTTFSGIDDDEAVSQASACLADYRRALAGTPTAVDDIDGFARSRRRAIGASDDVDHTFSLVFDTEQLACIRIGLPRVLDELARLDAPSTFFTTNIVHEVYSGALDVLRDAGHEVGLHGLHHEYLAGDTHDRQAAALAAMVEGLAPFGAVEGANFVFRLDATTLDAMATAGLSYHVQFMENLYRPFSYRPMPTAPLRTWTRAGSLWTVPITTETYNRPREVVTSMLRDAARRGTKRPRSHLTVLMHPFRDGSRRHIDIIGHVVEQLRALGFAPRTLRDAVRSQPAREPTCFVLDHLGAATPAEGTSTFWSGIARHQQRVARVYDALEARGETPALCATLPPSGTVYAVHPFLPHGVEPTSALAVDPLDPGWGTATLPSPTSEQRLEVVAIGPTERRRDISTVVRSAIPSSPSDLVALLPEGRMRVGYRLHRGRHVY